MSEKKTLQCRILSGANIAPRTASEAKMLLGKRVQYLRERDIDKSGRGYYFPQTGVITAIKGRNIDTDNSLSYDIYMGDLREMIEIPPVTVESAP